MIGNRRDRARSLGDLDVADVEAVSSTIRRRGQRRARPLLVGFAVLYGPRVRLLSCPEADAVDGRGDEDQYYEGENGDVADAAEADAAYT